MGKLIVVDGKERGSIPKNINNAVVNGSYPLVIITDAEMKTVYGRYGHKQLKGQDYRKIFKGAKDKIRDAIKDGSFATKVGSDVEDPDNSPNSEKPDNAEGPATLADTPIETWESSQGKKIQARLVSVENDSKFTFETASGKAIVVTADQLSDESVKRARELAQ